MFLIYLLGWPRWPKPVKAQASMALPLKGLIRPLKGLIRPFEGLIRPLKGLIRPFIMCIAFSVREVRAFVVGAASETISTVVNWFWERERESEIDREREREREKEKGLMKQHQRPHIGRVHPVRGPRPPMGWSLHTCEC